MRPWMKNTTEAMRKVPLRASIHVGCWRFGATGAAMVPEWLCTVAAAADESAAGAGLTPDLEILLAAADGQLVPLCVGTATDADDHDATLPDSYARRTLSSSARMSDAFWYRV